MLQSCSRGQATLGMNVETQPAQTAVAGKQYRLTEETHAEKFNVLQHTVGVQCAMMQGVDSNGLPSPLAITTLQQNKGIAYSICATYMTSWWIDRLACVSWSAFRKGFLEGGVTLTFSLC